jgi:hypothetical protein
LGFPIVKVWIFNEVRDEGLSESCCLTISLKEGLRENGENLLMFLRGGKGEGVAVTPSLPTTYNLFYTLC